MSSQGIEGRSLRLVDTHSHLDECTEVDSVVERARMAGVVGIVAMGIDTSSNMKILELSKTYEGYVFPAIGVHPSEIKENAEEMVSYVEQNADRCVAVGEIGLDFWTKIDRSEQVKAFESLLEIALRKDKAVSIHSRGAWEEAYNIVERVGIRKAVFHWYSGSLEVLRKILDKGYYVSASPSAEYSKKHREAIEQMPLESLLLETDSPVKYKGVESEPADVFKTLKYVSELKGVEAETIARQTTENAVRLFRLSI